MKLLMILDCKKLGLLVFPILAIGFLTPASAESNEWDWRLDNQEYGFGENFKNYGFHDFNFTDRNVQAQQSINEKFFESRFLTINTKPTEDEIAKSIVVHFSGGVENQVTTFHSFTGMSQ